MLLPVWHSLLKRWSSRLSRPKRRPRRAYRSPLYAEELESRLAPAGNTFIWTGTVSADWSIGLNWQGGQAPTGLAANQEDLIFPATATNKSTYNDLGGAVFNSITFQGSGYQLSGNALTLGDPTVSGSGRINVQTGVSNNQILLDIQLGGTVGNRQFITVNSGADLKISGKLTGVSSIELAKDGPGTLILSADNSGFTGPITVVTNGGIVRITNAKALGDTSAGTTVGANAQLQVDTVSGNIAENLILNGSGIINDGSLLNFAGNNTWAGAIQLDSDTTIGAAAGSLTISGQISDLGAGHNLTKEGPGRIVLTNANTYRGTTTINDGVLEIRNAAALGTADGTAATGTTVNRTVPTNKAGTLELNAPGFGAGLTVVNERLVLNGPGFGNVGALYSSDGNNTWTGNVILGSPAPNGHPVSIGVAEPSFLTITGVVSGSQSLTKIDLGTLAFTNNNTYTGSTTVRTGILEIRDSNGLGSAFAGTSVEDGATLKLEVDSIPDSVTGTTNTLNISEPLTITGLGASNVGALFSSSGINSYNANITLLGSQAGIGVAPDPNPTNNPNYFTNDYSLTVIGSLSGAGNLFKLGTGHLILPNANTGFSGDTNIRQGWITIRDNNSLGGRVANRHQNLQRTVTVESGAALHLRPNSGNFTLPQNFVVGGIGITHPFPLINNRGAIVNLAGNNTIPGNVTLRGQVGIGVEEVFGASRLDLTGWILETTPVINVSGSAQGGPEEDINVIDTKSTQGGTITLDVDVYPAEDDVRVYLGDFANDRPNAILVYDSTTNGDFSNPTNENRAIITIVYTSTDATATAVHAAGRFGFGSGYQLGPVNTSYSALTSTKISIVINQGGNRQSRTQWTYTAQIVPNAIFGGGITKLGSQLLTIQGDGTYTGDVIVAEGVVRAHSNTALGTAATGTDTDGSQAYSETTTTVGPGIAEVQRFVVTGTGTYTLTFNGATTAPLSTSASASQVQAALNALATIGGAGGSVTVTRSFNNYAVTFGGALVGQNLPSLTGTPVTGTPVVTISTDLDGDGSALELGNQVASLYGGVSSGLEVWYEKLVLDSPGNVEFGDAPLTVLSNDHMWRGPMTLTRSSPIQVQPGARLNVYGAVDDATNTSASGSNLSLTGGGDLALAGVNTYRGTTFVNQGALLLENSTALGSNGVAEVQTVTLSGATTGTFTLTFNGQTTPALPFAATADQVKAALNALTTIGGVGGSVDVARNVDVITVTFRGNLLGFDQPELIGTGAGGTNVVVGTLTQGAGGTVVSDGASLQLAGSLTVAEPLILQGQGLGQASNVPAAWFSEGPAPVNNGPTVGNQAVTGRVTGVATDPADANVIYLATAGGGAWKTVNGGKTWLPLFDYQNGNAEQQRVTVTGATGTFTLTFNGQTTAALPVGATARQVEAALNALASIGGASGFVTVSQSGNQYTVTFEGNLRGVNLAQMTGAGSGGANVTVTTLGDGIPSDAALYVGAIAHDPTTSGTLYIGTGETNNSLDSFYGTGIYKTTNYGVTWTLVTSTNGANPFDGKGISKIIVDPNSPSTLYVASGDGGSGRDEVQRVTPNVSDGSTFTLTFTGADATGTVVSLTTAPITFLSGSANRQANATAIQNALNALGNIGGVGGLVTVTPPSGGFGGGNRYTITFGGTLSRTNVQQLTGNPGPPPGFPSVDIRTFRDGGSLLVVNGTQGNGATDGPGVWRFQNGDWFNLTAVVSNNRQNVNGQAPFDAPGATSPNGQGPPRTPGPDDDYRISFPQSNATWSDIALVYTDITNTGSGAPAPVLYAALGTASGNGNPAWNPPTGLKSLIRNGVFWCRNPTSNQPIWYVGTPGGTDANPATPPTNPDARSGNQFPVSNFSGYPTTLPPEINGNIKIAAIAGSTLITTTVYAAVADPNGALRTIQKSTNGGHSWAATGGSPGNYMSNQGKFANAIWATDANTVFVGGFDLNGTNHLFMTTDGGGAWTPILVGANGEGLQTGIHAIRTDPQGQLLVGTDGGIWRRDTNNNYIDLNGNLAISQVNSVASHPTDLGVSYAGLQHNGTVKFTNDLAWSAVDLTGTGVPVSDVGGGHVRVDPENPNNVYHVMLRPGQSALIRRSNDGGLNWTTIFTTTSTTAPLVLDRVNTARLLVGGTSLQQSLDRGNSFTSIGPGGISPSAIGIAAFQGVFVPDPDFSQVGDRLANTYDPDTIYITNGDEVRLTKNGGVTWVDRTSDLVGLGSLADLVVDPTNRDTVYVVRSAFGGEKVLRSTDAGRSWTDITFNLPDLPVWKVVVDPRVVRNEVQTVTLSGTLAGNTFTLTFRGQTTASLPGTATAADVQAALSALSTIGTGNVLVSQSGNTFTITFLGNLGGADQPALSGSSSAGLVLAFATVQEGASGDLYVGTDEGVYKLPAGSTTWQRFGAGLGNVQVRDLELNVNTNTLLAGTYGRGVYRMFLHEGQANAGALTAVSGSAVWAGPIMLAGPTAISALGSQTLQIQNDLTLARLNIVGTISDLVPGANNQLTKLGGGTVTLSGANTYGGVTEVKEGILVVNNPQALGQSGSSQGTFVDSVANPNTALVLQSDLELEPLFVKGDGVPFNGHNTGVVRNISNVNTYTGPLTLQGHATIGVDTGSSLTIGSKSSLRGTGTITDAGGTFNLTKELTGTLALGGANTYDGITTVNQGILKIQHPDGLGTGGSAASQTVVLDGAQLQMSGGITVATEDLRLSGSGIFGTGALLNASGANTWSGPITLARDPGFSPTTTPPTSVTIGVPLNAPGDQLTINGAIGEDVANTGLQKVGQARLILDNNGNSYGGPTTIVGGALQVLQGGALGTANNTSLLGTIVQAGTALELAGAGFTVAGEDVTINGTGTSEVQLVNVTGSAGSFTLTFNGQTTTSLAFNATAAQIQTALNNLSTIGGAGGSVAVTALGGGAFMVVFGGNLASRNQPQITGTGSGGTTVTTSTVEDGGAGALVNRSGNNAWTGNVTLQTASTVNVAASTQLTLGAAADGQVRNTTPAAVPAPSLTKTGTGTLIFPRDNSYTGATFINEGVLNIRSNGALGAIVNEQQTVTLSGPLTGTFNLRFNGQTTALLSANSTAAEVRTALENLSTIGPGNVTVSLSGSTYTVTFVGALAGTNQPQMTGTGFDGTTVAIATTRDGSQGTFVSSGATLEVQGGITVTGEPLQVSGTGTNNAGALHSVSGNNTWQATAGVAGNDPIVLLTGNTTIAVDAGSSLVVQGTISDGTNTFAVTKIGGGALEYAGTTANSYDGATSVNDGTLRLNKPAGVAALAGTTLNVGDGSGAAGSAVVQWLNSNQAPSTTAATVASDGKLDLNDNTQVLASLSIADGAATTGTGATGALTVNSLNMTGGTLSTGAAGSSVTLGGNVTATSTSSTTATIDGSGKLNLGSAARTFDIGNGPKDNDFIVSAIIDGTVGLTKSGAGTAVFNAVNTYTGTTNVTGGSLIVNGQIGNVTVNNATLGGAGTVGTITSTGGTVSPGQAVNAHGTLTSGATTLDSNSTLFIDFNSTTNFDKLAVQGAIDITNSNLAGRLGYASTLGETFTIITATGGVTGQFKQGAALFIDGRKFAISYNANDVTLTRVVANSVTSLSANPVSPSVFGQPVTFTATVQSEAGPSAFPPTGNVTFIIDGGTANEVQRVKALTNGQAALESPADLGGPLAVGTHTVRVQYAGSPDFNPSSAGPINYVVNKANASFTITPSVTPSSVFGQAVNFEVQINAVAPGAGSPTGDVTLFVDGASRGTKTLTGTKATYTIADLSAGTHSFNVSYTGDGNFNSFTQTTYPNFSYTVNKAATTTAKVIPSFNPITFGDTVQLQTTVAVVAPGAGNPTGRVDFFDGSTLLGSGNVNPTTGVATFTTAAGQLRGGTHSLTATYVGDSNFATSNSNADPLSFTVNPSPTSTTVVTDPSPSAFTQTVFITATVTAQAPGAGLAPLTGTVVFKIDGVQQGSPVSINSSTGKATINVSSMTPGTHTITAEYSGNGDFAASSGQTNHTVRPPSVNETLTSSKNPSVYGESLTYTVQVTARPPGTGTPTGTITFFVDGNQVGGAETLVNGTASKALPTLLEPGDHTIRADYSGDANFDLQSVSITQTVNKAGTTTTITNITPNPSAFGQAVTFTATVARAAGVPAAAGDPTGQVTFKIGSTVLGQGTLNASGVATLVTAAVPAGSNQTVTAVYEGDNHFATSTSAGVSLTVNKGSVTISDITSTAANPLAYGNALDLKVTVTANGSPPIKPTGKVTFTSNLTGVIGQADVNATTGVATLVTTTLDAGNHQITATYDGDSNYNASAPTNPYAQTILQGASTLNLTSIGTAVYGQSAVTAEVKPVAPAAGVPTGTVTFKVDGTPIGPVTLVNGKATLPVLALTPGTYTTITADYSGSINFLPSSSTTPVSLTVNKANTVTTVQASAEPSIVGQSVNYIATVTAQAPGSGIPTGTVTFTIDGVAKAPVTLDVNGQATITDTVLTEGTHTVVAVYNGDSNYVTSTSATLNHSVVLPPGGANSSFVWRVYLDLLGRVADASGHAYWTNLLNVGVPRHILILQLMGAPEYQARKVAEVFRAYLRREPDAASLGYFVGLLQQGAGIQRVRELVLGSPEYFFNQGGGSNAGFVSALYRDVLGRAADPAGFQYLMVLLQQFTPRDVVARIVLQSREAEQILVNNTYLTFLRRPADSAGLDFFTNAMQSGWSEEFLIAVILATDEYFRR